MFDKDIIRKPNDHLKNISQKARSFSRKSIQKNKTFKARQECNVVKENSQSWFISLPKKMKKKNRMANDGIKREGT